VRRAAPTDKRSDPSFIVECWSSTRWLECFRSFAGDFAEAYLVACAESTGIGRIASFDRAIDRAIDRVATIERLEP